MHKEQNIKENHKEVVQNSFTPHDITNTALSLGLNVNTEGSHLAIIL